MTVTFYFFYIRVTMSTYYPIKIQTSSTWAHYNNFTLTFAKNVISVFRRTERKVGTRKAKVHLLIYCSLYIILSINVKFSFQIIIYTATYIKMLTKRTG